MPHTSMPIAQINKVVVIVPEKVARGVLLPNWSVLRLNATLMVLLLDGFGVRKRQLILPQVSLLNVKDIQF